MAISPQGMSVQALYRRYRDGKLVVNRQYQRKLVWTVSEKQGLVDSVLKDYPLPLFLFAQRGEQNGDAAPLEIIDGMQRLNAIFSFIEQGFTHESQCFDISEFTRARQASESGIFENSATNIARLPADQCANFLDYPLAVTIFPGQPDVHVTDVFGRINSGGKQLSDQERRQAGVLSPFAGLVRLLAAEIRGDVSRESLLLYEMPEISIETSRNLHGYALKAEDIFWCSQGILRTGDLRDSDDEQVLADVCASILFQAPVESSGDFLNRLYSDKTEESKDVNRLLAVYGRDRLLHEVKSVISEIRIQMESYDGANFAFRKLVYPKPTSNAQKAPFYAVFMAFFEFMYRESRAPVEGAEIMGRLENLTNSIAVGQKHTKSAERRKNIDIVKGLISDVFVKPDVPALAHGPSMVIDFENSIRRSRTETARYEFKQGILRLDADQSEDPEMIPKIIRTICGIANVGPDADGFLFVGVADNKDDSVRVENLYNISAVEFGHVFLVGIDREYVQLNLSPDQYMRKMTDGIGNSELSDPLKTQVLSSIDVIEYKELAVVRLRIPKQSSASFVGGECFFREGSATKAADAPKTAAIAALFNS